MGFPRLHQAGARTSTARYAVLGESPPTAPRRSRRSGAGPEENAAEMLIVFRMPTVSERGALCDALRGRTEVPKSPLRIPRKCRWILLTLTARRLRAWRDHEPYACEGWPRPTGALRPTSSRSPEPAGTGPRTNWLRQRAAAAPRQTIFSSTAAASARGSSEAAGSLRSSAEDWPARTPRQG